MDHPLPPPLTDLIAERFRVLGEPLRIRILDRLRAGPRTGRELAAELGASQQNISHHLVVLHRAGVLGRRKAGTRVLYDIADPSVFELCELVCGGLSRHLAELEGALAGAGGRRGGTP